MNKSLKEIKERFLLEAWKDSVETNDMKYLIDRVEKLEAIAKEAKKCALAFSPAIRKPGRTYAADGLIMLLIKLDEKHDASCVSPVGCNCE